MENQKTSKKALRHLIEGYMQDVMKSLALPEPDKKVKKELHRNSKKLAVIFSDVIKREEKKKRKASRSLENAAKSKVGRKDKTKKKAKEPVVEQPLHAEPV